MKLSLTPEMLQEIAEQLDYGMSCFYNVKTGELEYYPEEAEDNYMDDENPWQDIIDKIDEAPYNEYLKFSKMDSDESYRIMERFVGTIEGDRTRRIFEEAIGKRKPFQQFRHLIQDYPDLLDTWYDYKLQRYIDHVQAILDDYNFGKDEDDVQESSIAPAMMPGSPAEGIFIRNAGLVILNSYIPVLFERLGLTRDHRFIDETSQTHAAHYLQYLVTGQSSTEELLLPLNKLLCRLAVSDPIPEGTTITPEQAKLMDGLLHAAIGYWPAIGNCSIDGFRGNWLVRDGLLGERDGKWELTVEKRAYDILLHKAPFSFSIIKYPWMDKPVYVNWPY